MAITAKITAQKLINLFKEMGVDAVLVEDDNDVEYEESAIYEAIDANRALILEPKITEKLKSEIAGVSGSKLRRKLVQATGISRKVLDEINDDDEAIKMALKFYEDKFSGDANEMNAKFAEQSQAFEAERAAFEARLAETESTWRNRYNSRNIIDEIETSVLSKIKLPETADKKHHARKMFEELSAKYDLDFDEETGKTIVKQKGKEFIAQNKAGTKPFDWDEAASEYIKPYGYNQTDNREVSPLDEMKRRAAGGNGFAPQGKPIVGADAPRNPQEMVEYVMKKNLQKAGAAQ